MTMSTTLINDGRSTLMEALIIFQQHGLRHYELNSLHSAVTLIS